MGPTVTFDLLHVTLSLGDLATLIAKGFCALPFIPFC